MKTKNNFINFFSQEKNLVAFVTTKEAGDFKGNIKKLEVFLEKNDIQKFRIAMPDLVHGNNVFKVENNKIFFNKLIKATDSVFTKEKNIFLALTFADCFPIFIFDRKKEKIGLIHAGWKSVSKKIIEKTLRNFSKKDRKDMEIIIGPGIDFKNYEFSFKIAQKNFSAYPKRIRNRKGLEKCLLDLRGIIKDKLQEEGILKKNIFNCGINTFTDQRFFSARRDKFSVNNVKACAAVIGIVE